MGNGASFIDREQEALWYLGAQRVIHASDSFPGLAEFVLPAGTIIYAHLHKDGDEAYYVLSGEAVIACGGERFHVGTGTFLFLPCNVPHYMEVDKSAPFKYLTWMTPAGFAHEVTMMGSPSKALLIVPPPSPDSVKIYYLADLLKRWR